MSKKGKLSCALFASYFLGIPSVFCANTLDVEFTGLLVGTMCQVSAESVSQKIKLYNLRWQAINSQGVSDVTPFSIAIDKCSATDLKKNIKLTWKSNQLVNVDGNSFLATQGDSNVLLGLIDKDEKPVIWNKPITVGAVSVVGNTQPLDFGVFVRKPSTGEAKIGDFSGSITFNVEYE